MNPPEHPPSTAVQVVTEMIWTHWNFSHHLKQHHLKTLKQHHDLNLEELLLLTLICQHAHQPKKLAQALGVTPHRVSRALDDLSQKGLILRSIHPTDARKLHIELTDRGKNTLTDASRTFQQPLQDLFAAFSPQELKTLLDLMQKLRQALPSGEHP